MGKWTSELLRPKHALGENRHVSDGDIARLAEGSVDAETRRPLVSHLNRCSECYDVFEATLRDMELDEGVEPDERQPFWKNGKLFAVAASFVIVILSGALYFEFQQGMTPRLLHASVSLDNELRTILIENSAVQWETWERVDRLARLLKKRGVDVGSLNRVVLAKPYYPTKSIFPPKETLKIRIEDGVAYIEIVKNSDK